MRIVLLEYEGARHSRLSAINHISQVIKSLNSLSLSLSLTLTLTLSRSLSLSPSPLSVSTCVQNITLRFHYQVMPLAFQQLRPSGMWSPC